VALPTRPDRKFVDQAARFGAALGLLALAGAWGCNSKKDCTTIADATAKDWCYFEEATSAAEDDELSTAVTAVQQIQDQMVRSAAIDKVIMAGPDGLDQTTVQNLCNQVQRPYADTCMRTWNRPHLWQQ